MANFLLEHGHPDRPVHVVVDSTSFVVAFWYSSRFSGTPKWSSLFYSNLWACVITKSSHRAMSQPHSSSRFARVSNDKPCQGDERTVDRSVTLGHVWSISATLDGLPVRRWSRTVQTDARRRSDILVKISASLSESSLAKLYLQPSRKVWTGLSRKIDTSTYRNFLNADKMNSITTKKMNECYTPLPLLLLEDVNWQDQSRATYDTFSIWLEAWPCGVFEINLTAEREREPSLLLKIKKKVTRIETLDDIITAESTISLTCTTCLSHLYSEMSLEKSMSKRSKKSLTRRRRFIGIQSNNINSSRSQCLCMIVSHV